MHAAVVEREERKLSDVVESKKGKNIAQVSGRALPPLRSVVQSLAWWERK